MWGLQVDIPAGASPAGALIIIQSACRRRRRRSVTKVQVFFGVYITNSWAAVPTETDRLCCCCAGRTARIVSRWWIYSPSRLYRAITAETSILPPDGNSYIIYITFLLPKQKERKKRKEKQNMERVQNVLWAPVCILLYTRKEHCLRLLLLFPTVRQSFSSIVDRSISFQRQFNHECCRRRDGKEKEEARILNNAPV